MTVIRVRHLSKNYGPLQAVHDVSLDVPSGSVFGMLGPNGAGKTTTIECIIGLKQRNAGQIEVLGLDPAGERQALFGSIGVQLQETVYQRRAKVYELCQLFAAMYPKPLDYRELLEKFNLKDKGKDYMANLSGGEKQKVAIILALIANPQILFLDELTTGLDPRSRREMWSYLKELQKEGRTIFLTTHYMEEAAFLCDQIAVIHQGKIAALDTVEGLIEQAALDLVITFETSASIQQIKKIPGVNKIEQEGEKVAVYCAGDETLVDLIVYLREHHVDFHKIDIQRPNLEDAFLKLTGTEWKGAAS